jgi:hypothetical protein
VETGSPEQFRVEKTAAPMEATPSFFVQNMFIDMSPWRMHGTLTPTNDDTEAATIRTGQ